ncbi:hypothetical protein AA23498_0145 [Acetobacter nitrogenifigens DSM 23921 = NBRC 105050]|uniref:Uncharacterized protein n=1 Tax=Acetobacter nitrogenifigens DSM 23921 = NBRC 105050 TaxID=1120919 RepID=A0A511X8R2_9PROT|nr:hypothetical protein [Acetobacter nitrogenifigens]GBQ87470.1 hypothetical protein AA23498_0145 [Acetobacter nitrogenifigens DSM 23921 = NBRC 105050]GEN59340.1 hypothetical protein ANI02nite_12240 [Acetobacter nitrogenifigens DSM 23921 = NBRC 105050]
MNHEIAQTQKEIAREKLNLEKFSRRVEYIEIVDKCFRRQVDSGFADGRIEFLNKLKEIRQKSGRISNVFSAQEEKLKERFIESPFNRLIELQEIQYQITAIFSLETGRAIQSLIACMRITQITRNECIMSVHSREKNMARLKRIIPICRARHQRVWQSLQEREFNGLKS